MKCNILVLTSVTLLLALNANSQQTGGGGQSTGGASGGTGTGNAGNQPGNAVPNPANPPGVNLPPGLEKRQQLPPDLERRDQLPPGLASGSNQLGVVGSNQFGTAANPFGTNAGGLLPTSEPGAPNRVFGTNQLGGVFQDQAVTPADRTLLLTIHQQVQPLLGAGAATAPVHFIVRQGIVAIVGMVPTPEEKQQLLVTVRNLPGVVQVVDRLVVRGTVVPGVSNRLGARIFPGMTNRFGVISNAPPPFGITNSPPDLERPQR